MKLTEAIKRAKRGGRVPLIAEIKACSPQEGNLLRGRDPVEVVSQYRKGGAVAISVVTEARYFGGNIEILKKVTEQKKLPVLRKDFINTEKEVEKTKELGADALLLITARLPPGKLKRLNEYARSIGLETVVEIHTREELEGVKELNLDILGINNKNILSLERGEDKIEVTLSLLPFIPPGVILLSESGIRKVEDAKILIKKGVDALLMGTTLLKADDIYQKTRKVVWLK
ncbi:MAG: indole-3-glycerol-phosphate synthase [Candidatus Aerophobetes bacterium]|nr:indole-3-glycerol-phosphate synthase [Candidatus Aerophobetes bacterium]